MSVASPDTKDSLAKLNRLQLLVEDYRTSRQQLNNPEIATPQEMNPLAAELAILAEFWGISYGARPFSNVAINWWRCDDPDVLRAIEELKAKLTAELWKQAGTEEHADADSEAPTFFASELRSAFGVSQTTLRQKLDFAGVTTPGRGGGNHRYSLGDALKACQVIIDTVNKEETKVKCRLWKNENE